MRPNKHMNLSILTHGIAFSIGLAIGAISVFAVHAQREPAVAHQAAIQRTDIPASGRQVSYERHEFTWPETEHRTTPLLTLVYDIPYLGACGVFPPLHVLNQVFARGGSDGGMGPGATWDPFEITSEEYDSLVHDILQLDPRTLGDTARYTWLPFIFDPSFDHVQEHLDWVTAVCAKHKESYHNRSAEAQSHAE